MELIDKEKVLKENIKDIAQMDEALLLIDEQYNNLASERKQIEENRKDTMKLDENLIASWNRLDVNKDEKELKNVEQCSETKMTEIGHSSEPPNGNYLNSIFGFHVI